MVDFQHELANAKSISQIFKLVKSAVWISTSQSRSGLELGISELENRVDKFLGAFHPMDSNIIVINKIPLERIAYLDTSLYNSYVFHILLYEYLRSMGYTKDIIRKDLCIGISEENFGKDHLVCQMAQDIKKFFPNIMYAVDTPKAPLRTKIVREFDTIATNYIG